MGVLKTFQVWNRLQIRFAALLVACLLAGLFALVSEAPADAATTLPTKMNFQGRITNSAGSTLANGIYNMRFKIWNAASGGASQWSEDRLVSASQGVQVTNGQFSVQLGSVTSLPASVFTSNSLYFEIELPTPASATTSSPVWTEGAMTPRNQLATTAYAFNSETLDGLDSAAFGQLDQNNVFTGNNTFNGTLQGGSSLTLGTGAAQGSLVLNDGNGQTGTLRIADTAGNYTYTIPVTTANDTFCLQTLANCGAGGGVSTVGALDGGTANANGAAIVGSTLYLQSASTSNAGLVNTTTQSFAGNKTFTGSVAVAGSTTLNDNVTVAANKTIQLVGGATSSRPASPGEGTVYYDTDTKKLETFANGKWQADRTDAVLVAASNSSQADKDAADYVVDGNTGAANDGDQIQINTALTAAAGKKVVLLAGTYIVDASIAISNNTTLVGMGDSSLIQLGADNSASTNLIENTDKTTGAGIYVGALKLDGQKSINSTHYNSGMYIEGVGSNVGPSVRKGPHIEGVTIVEFSGEAIILDTTTNALLSDLTLKNNDGSGVDLYESSDNRIINSFIGGSGWGGIDLRLNSFRNIIESNTLDGNDHGIGVNSGSVISGNVITNSTYAGLIMSGSNSVLVQNNSLTGNQVQGISLNSADGNIISNNMIADNGGDASNEGIQLSNSDNNTISGNKISDSSATSTNYPIAISANSISNYVHDNVFETGTINDLSSTTIYGGQIDGTGNYVIQPASNINLNKDTLVSSGSLTLGTSSVAGGLEISDGSSNTGRIVMAPTAGNYTYTIPVTTANDTFCMQTLANCADGGVKTVGALDGGTANATGASIVGTTIYLQSASTSNAGLVNTTAQSFAGNKTFTGTVTVSNAATVNGDLTVAGAINQTGTKLSLKASLAGNAAIGFTREMEIVGNYAYVINEKINGPFSIIDITNPSSPAVVSSITDSLLNAARDIRVVGRYAYVVSFNGEALIVIDVANPSAPAIVGSVVDATAFSGVHGLEIQGKYAYAAATSSGGIGRFTVVDISNPASPKVATSITNTAFNQSKQVDINGKYAYVSNGGATTGGLAVIDISNPLSPTLVGSALSSNFAVSRDVVANGKYAYMVGAGNDYFGVFDVSNPASPTLVGSLQDSVNMDEPFDITLNGRYAYVASRTSSNIAVVDVANPVAPTIVAGAGYSAPGISPVSAMMKGQLLYVNGNTNSNTVAQFMVLDTAGSTLGSTSTNNLTTNSLLVDGAADIADTLNVGDSLMVGQGGIQTYGNLVAGTATFNGGIQGGSSATLGSTTVQGTLVLNDGNGQTGTIRMGDIAGNYVYTVPVTTANDTFCMVTLANCGGAGGGVTTIGALNGGTANANGATITGSTLYLQSASASFAGLVSTGTQTIAGAKTFSGALTVGGVANIASGTLYVGGAGSATPGSISLGDDNGYDNVIKMAAGASLSGGTYNIPLINGGTDTFCLQALANCSSAGVNIVGTYSTTNTAATGATISGNSIIFQNASATAPGMVGTGAQTFAGNKTFNGTLTIANSATFSGQLTIGTVDTTGTLLVLDTKTDAGDPAGTNGAMYYNSSLKRFRCYQEGAWIDCTTGDGIAKKLADQAATVNTATMQNVSDLTFAIGANETYSFTLIMPIDISNANADMKYGITLPAGATITAQGTSPLTATTISSCAITASAQACAVAVSAAIRGSVLITGTVTNGATSGTFNVQFAQNTANATAGPTALKGANLRFNKL